jgi:hypothetical protein
MLAEKVGGANSREGPGRIRHPLGNAEMAALTEALSGKRAQIFIEPLPLL